MGVERERRRGKGREKAQRGGRLRRRRRRRRWALAVAAGVERVGLERGAARRPRVAQEERRGGGGSFVELDLSQNNISGEHDTL